MDTHKIVTVPRQGGYAARCDCGCGAITFGGFASRTAAREAIQREIERTESTTQDLGA